MLHFPADRLVGLIVVGLATPLGAFDLPVPADEYEARRMLDDGTLDSATWIRLEPLYDNPVCVPCGELDVLAPLVPERSADLPVSTEVLEHYVPWDSAGVERFFDDYPWLRQYEPVMTFSRAEATWGSVSARYYRSGLDNYTREQAGFDLSPLRPLRFGGRFDVAPAAALVERRFAAVDLGSLGSLTLGNSGPPADDGLLLGRFPAHAADSANSLDQWRYGEGRTWNGAVWRLSGAGERDASIVAFGHDLPTERAAGLRSEFRPWRKVVVRIGGSYLATRDSAPDRRPFFAGQVGISADLEQWKAGASTCVIAHDGVRAPVILSLEHLGDQAHVDAAVTWLPSGLAAPRSSVAGALLDRIGIGADTAVVPASLVCVDWSVERRIGQMFRVHPFVSYLFLVGGAGSDCRAGATADIRGPVQANISYRYRPGGLSAAVPADRHEAGLEIKHRIGAHFEAALTTHYDARSDGYQRLRAEIAPAWLPDSAMKIAPCLSVYTGSMHGADPRWGFRSELGLFPKVACHVRLELPFTMQNPGETIIDVRSAFTF